jgi:hypothetical protein
MHPMTTLRRLAAVPATLALGAALAPAAHAAPQLVQPLKACYVSADFAQRENMPIVAGGFERNVDVEVRFDGRLAGPPVLSDTDGVVTIRKLAAPFQAAGEREFTVTLTESDNPAVSLAATSRITALSVRLRPRSAATSDRVRIRGRGFTRANRAIWGHYAFRGKVRKTVRFAKRPRGACGRFSVRRRQIPIVRPHPGRWTLQVDQQRRYDPHPHTVGMRVRIDVHRVAGRP